MIVILQKSFGVVMIEAAKADTVARDVSDARTWSWLGLALTPGIGAARGRKLAELFNGVDRIFSASLTELEAAGLPAASAQSIAFGKFSDLAGEELDRIRALGGRIVAQDDADYPKRLYEIDDLLLVLYVRGSSEVINKYGLAVVGTCHPTPLRTRYGRAPDVRLGSTRPRHRERYGRGVDAAAHRGALNVHGQTVAIWGTGVDVTLPQGESEACRADSVHWRCDPKRVPFRHVSRPAKLSDP